jgi:hypothetical protein
VVAQLVLINQPYVDYRTGNRESRAVATRWSEHFIFTRNAFWWMQSYPEFVGYLSKHGTLIEATAESRVYRLGTAAK